VPNCEGWRGEQVYKKGGEGSRCIVVKSEIEREREKEPERTERERE